MTRKRNDSHSTEFGLWLREQPAIDSRIGYITSNIDYVWHNFKTGEWMLIEEKRYCAKVGFPQSVLFKLVHHACKWQEKYRGFHLLVFEKTSPEDGKVWLDKKEISKGELIKFLSFGGTQ